MPAANPLTRTAGWGAEQTFLPGDVGLLAWAYDFMLSPNTSLLFTAGRINATKLYLPGPTQITNLHAVMSTAGGTLTANQCFAGVWDAAFNLIGLTADMSGTWGGATGFLTMPLTQSAFAAPPFTIDTPYCYVGGWYNGTTAPTFRSAAPAQGVNGLLTGINARSVLCDAGLTVIGGAPTKLGNFAVNTAMIWWGLS